MDPNIAARLNTVAKIGAQIKGQKGAYIICKTDYGRNVDIYEIRYVSAMYPSIIMDHRDAFSITWISYRYSYCIMCQKTCEISNVNMCRSCQQLMINGQYYEADGNFFTFDGCLTNNIKPENRVNTQFIYTENYACYYRKAKLVNLREGGVDDCGFIEKVSKIKLEICESFDSYGRRDLWQALLCWQDWRKYMPLYAYCENVDITSVIMKFAIQMAINDMTH